MLNELKKIAYDEKCTVEELLDDNLTAVNFDDLYVQYLDENGSVNVGGIDFYPSRILSELDPTAYDCGLNDYIDSADDVFTIDESTYYYDSDVEELIESFE